MAFLLLAIICAGRNYFTKTIGCWLPTEFTPPQVNSRFVTRSIYPCISEKPPFARFPLNPCTCALAGRVFWANMLGDGSLLLGPEWREFADEEPPARAGQVLGRLHAVDLARSPAHVRPRAPPAATLAPHLAPGRLHGAFSMPLYPFHDSEGRPFSSLRLKLPLPSVQLEHAATSENQECNFYIRVYH